jgi:dipeptidyl aminopeptidase/acylaminoacyl peptidase
MKPTRDDRRPRAPREAEIGLVRLAPDGRRLAFARHDGEARGVWVDDPNVQTGPTRVVASDGWRAEEILWSPDGQHVAYLIGGGPKPGGGRAVGWAKSFAHGEIGRADGVALCWSTKGTGLLVADLERKAVVARALDPAAPPVELCRIDDDGDPHFPPRLTAAPDGSRVAFTCRRVADSVAEVWIIAQESEAAKASLLTQIPGSALHVLPFWSPKGVTLGILMVHLEHDKTGIVVVPRLEGDGEILYESELLDRAETPAWSPSTRFIAFFQTPAAQHEFTKSGPSRLALLDLEKRAIVGLTEPDEIKGNLRFADDKTIVVDGGAVAHVLTFAQAL